jgi:organic hydroperoxide reductase OsmC/OhrA
MQELPHHYRVAVAGGAEGDVELSTNGLPSLRSASPAEFDGPGDRWSPETLLVGAVGDCFVLTFRAVARASRLPWTSIHCDVTGTLDRIDRATQFTHVNIDVRLAVPAGTSADQARRALEKAERGCLISNSLKAAIHLTTTVDVTAETLGGALVGA